MRISVWLRVLADGFDDAPLIDPLISDDAEGLGEGGVLA
jgi:hypothetical protein